MLNENAEGFPGYQDTSYKHFTYIRIIEVTNDLWMFLRKVPLTLLGDGKVLSEKQARLGTTLIAEIFGPGINYPALKKYFEFYHSGQYKKAYDIAKIFHERYPKRELIFVLYQSVSLSLDYIEEKNVIGQHVIPFSPTDSKLGFLNHKAEIIKARNLYKQGRVKEARAKFKSVLDSLGEGEEGTLENILLWLLDKFRVVTSYSFDTKEYNTLLSAMTLYLKLEPSMSIKNLRFEEITINDINKSMFNCRLGAELAVLSNIVAYYFSDLGQYKKAAKLYGVAWCFVYNDLNLSLITLKNLKKSYIKLNDSKNVELVDREIDIIHLKTHKVAKKAG